MGIETSLTIISIALVLWVVFAIWILWQVGRALKKLNSLLDTISSSLPSILANVEEATTRLNNLTKDVSHKVEPLVIGISALRTVLSFAGNRFQQGLWGTALATIGNFATIKAIGKGLKAFLHTYQKTIDLDNKAK